MHLSLSAEKKFKTKHHIIMQEVPMNHWCIYWHKIIDNGSSMIMMYPCINVSSRNDVVLNQKDTRWWQTAIS